MKDRNITRKSIAENRNLISENKEKLNTNEPVSNPYVQWKPELLVKPNAKAGESNMNTPSGKSDMTTGKKK